MGNTNEKRLKQKEMKKIGTDGYKYDEAQLKGVIQNFMEFGFTEEQIVQAWNRTNCKPDLMLTYLTKNQYDIFEEIKKYNNIVNDDYNRSIALQQSEEEKMIQQAIELSIQNQSDDHLSNAELYLRTDDPIGLQNLGRTCYFNSFLQTLYHIRELRDPILRIDISDNSDNACDQRNKLNEMLKQFQLTFAAMLKSQKNFTDPSNLFDVLKGLSGQVFRQGEENDFWEFQNSTLEYLEQAFMKESEIDTVDLFKSYLRLQSNASSMFPVSNVAIKQNAQGENKVMQNKQEISPSKQRLEDEIKNTDNDMDEEFVIFDAKRGLSSFVVLNNESTLIQGVDNDNQTNLLSNQASHKKDEMISEEISSEKNLTLQRQDSHKKKQKKIKNPITELFFGVGEEKISIYSKECTVPEVKVHDIPIGIFNLEVKTGDLYSALNSYFKYSVGDYQPDPIDNLSQSTIIKNQKKVDIQLSIKTAPKILNFYINRIHYNIETKSAEKSNKKFTFDKEIYIDNYMKGNDQEFEEQTKQIQQIDKELAVYQAKMLQFQNYDPQEGQNNNQSILQAFELVKTYFKSQIQKSDNFIDIQELIDDVSKDSKMNIFYK